MICFSEVCFFSFREIMKKIVHQSIEDVERNIDVDEEFQVQLVDSDGEEESFFISTSSNHSDETSSVGNERNADWDFLSSLLPDVQRMDAKQKAKFRNSLLTAIDMTLYGEEF